MPGRQAAAGVLGPPTGVGGYRECRHHLSFDTGKRKTHPGRKLEDEVRAMVRQYSITPVKSWSKVVTFLLVSRFFCSADEAEGRKPLRAATPPASALSPAFFLNVQHPTSNVQHPREESPTWALVVGRWTLDVQFSSSENSGQSSNLPSFQLLHPEVI